MRTSTARPYGNVSFPRPTWFVIKRPAAGAPRRSPTNPLKRSLNVTQTHSVSNALPRVVINVDPYNSYATFTVGEGRGTRVCSRRNVCQDATQTRSKYNLSVGYGIYDVPRMCRAYLLSGTADRNITPLPSGTSTSAVPYKFAATSIVGEGLAPPETFSSHTIQMQCKRPATL